MLVNLALSVSWKILSYSFKKQLLLKQIGTLKLLPSADRRSPLNSQLVLLEPLQSSLAWFGTLASQLDLDKIAGVQAKSRPKHNFVNAQFNINFFLTAYKTKGYSFTNNLLSFYTIFKAAKAYLRLKKNTRFVGLITLLKLQSLTGANTKGSLFVSNKQSSKDLQLLQTLNDYFFAPSFFSNINKNSRWLSMEEIINHFLFYSEGPCLPPGFSQGAVEAPKGHLGVSIVSSGTNKPVRARIRSSILVMAGHVNNLVQNVGMGDFVCIVSASNIVVGEIDR